MLATGRHLRIVGSGHGTGQQQLFARANQATYGSSGNPTMETLKPQSIGGTLLTDRHNRQKQPTGCYLRAKCGQDHNQVTKGVIVWYQPYTHSFHELKLE
jgi:hypothetical protein